MGRIAEGKRKFAESIDEELDEIAVTMGEVVRRAREGAKDAKGLNGLGTGLNGFASTLETAVAQLEDIRSECRAWLDVGWEPTVERDNLALLERSA
jgi:hypothetical protein